MTEQDPSHKFSSASLFPTGCLLAVLPAAEMSWQKISSVILSYPVSVLGLKTRGLSRTSDIHSYVCSSSGDVCVSQIGASAGLPPGIVSSLDVAHSVIEQGICLFTWGRHKEILGVREGERELGRNLAAIYGLMGPMGNQLWSGL